MQPKVNDREWAAFCLGQFVFAIIGPTEALDAESTCEKAKKDWDTASDHAAEAAERLGLKLNLESLLEKKGTQDKHVAIGQILIGVLNQVERDHGRIIADLVRIGNIVAACMAYGTKSKEVSPIQLGFLEISHRLDIPDSIISEFLHDPMRNLNTFAAIAVQHAREAIAQEPKALEAVEVKPGFLGITVDLKKLSQRIIKRFKAKRAKD